MQVEDVEGGCNTAALLPIGSDTTVVELMPGTVLVREWDAREYRVKVTDDGRYELDGQRPGTASTREPAQVLAIRARKKPGETPGFQDGGGPKEDRTPDLRIANAALSQLSYRP